MRPRGPLDTPEDIDGAALETVVFQELRAINQYGQHGYAMYFWRTASGHEVDFILYGPKGLIAIEVRRSDRVSDEMLGGLRTFLKEYPLARAYLLTGGGRDRWEGKIRVLPVEIFLRNIDSMLAPVN